MQDAVSCLTPVPLSVSPGGWAPSAPGRSHTVSLGETPVLLGGPSRLRLSVDHHYCIVRQSERGPWKIVTTAYYYSLDDANGHEILAYHWHPPVRDDEPGTRYPHLHVGAGAVDAERLVAAGLSSGANLLRSDLSDAHLPTQRILLEDVVELAIEQFHVPAPGDWRNRLARTRAQFEQTHGWRTYQEWLQQRASLSAPSRPTTPRRGARRRR